MTKMHYRAYHVNMSINRKLAQQICKDLEKKIVLLAGPRQSGKTTLAKTLFSADCYLNFDSGEDRRVIMAQSWPRDVELVIFDELHKRKNWKTWVKGIYDKEGVRPRLLVTGSARLDITRRGGDSLAGRHFLLRLHPFSVAELKDEFSPNEALSRILSYGGFPEPFLANNEEDVKRWRLNYLDRILRQDLIELEDVRQIKSIEILVDLLADRVGSTISFASLARDLEVSPHSVKKWIQILESLYVVFVVSPYSKKLSRSLLKEPKVYFYDTGRVKNEPGARFENAVACALLKDLHYRSDVHGEKTHLYYLRDKEKREVDFLCEVDGKVHSIVEAKVSDSAPSSALHYYSTKLNPKNIIQVVHTLAEERQYGDIRVVPAAGWLATMEE
jgi:predicted AAA+ superfamily ATPase